MNDLSLPSTQWAALLTRFPQAHLLQTAAWGDFKAGFGWEPVRVTAENAAAQILFRHLPLGLTFAYIPKGPLGQNWQSLWPAVDAICRRKRAIFLKVEPDAWEAESPVFLDQLAGFLPAKPIQPRRTAVISLQGSENEWLERMKQKTRYNVRLAERKEIVVRETLDLHEFYRLALVTGQRDGFGVHSLDYYQQMVSAFAPQGLCTVLQAEFEGRALAALILFASGQRAWYLHGASSDEERNRMPTYLLQWQAMRWAAARGCTEYDLWGVPDAPEEQLEAEFSSRSDGLWGVYRFKRGFGGLIQRTAGAWDRIYSRPLYAAYRWALERRQA